MPKFLASLVCNSCEHEHDQVLDVENTSGPEDDDANSDNAPECANCGDVDWRIEAYEEVRGAAASPDS